LEKLLGIAEATDLPPKPAASIDFARTFSLPVGVPVDLLPAPALATYLGDLAADAAFLYLDRPARRPLDPISRRRVARRR